VGQREHRERARGHPGRPSQSAAASDRLQWMTSWWCRRAGVSVLVPPGRPAPHYKELARTTTSDARAACARGMLFDAPGGCWCRPPGVQRVAGARAGARRGSHAALWAEATVRRGTLRDTVRRHERSAVPADRPDSGREPRTGRRSAGGAWLNSRDPWSSRCRPATPDDALAAHLFGYVGEVTDQQLTRADNDGVHAGDVIGQAGVEQTTTAC